LTKKTQTQKKRPNQKTTTTTQNTTTPNLSKVQKTTATKSTATKTTPIKENSIKIGQFEPEIKKDTARVRIEAQKRKIKPNRNSEYQLNKTFGIYEADQIIVEFNYAVVVMTSVKSSYEKKIKEEISYLEKLVNGDGFGVSFRKKRPTCTME